MKKIINSELISRSLLEFIDECRKAKSEEALRKREQLESDCEGKLSRCCSARLIIVTVAGGTTPYPVCSQCHQTQHRVYR